MKTIRAPVAELTSGERVLSRETSHYLCRVMRLTEGARFVAFDPAAHLEADATILAASAEAARVEVGAPRRAAVVADAELVLVYALAKGDKVDAVVRDATELGATRIVIAKTERSVVKTSGAEERVTNKLDRWRRVAAQAARQCGRADPPAIEGVLRWEQALDGAGCEGRFCLDPLAVMPLGAALGPLVAERASIAFAIGPEGGLSSDEIATALERGFVPATLGPFVLRTETVAAAVLGAVRVLAGQSQDPA